MATLAELEARRDELNRKIASGVKSVSSGGESVVNRSLEELRDALDEVNRQIAALGTSKSPRRFYVRHTRGY